MLRKLGVSKLCQAIAGAFFVAAIEAIPSARAQHETLVLSPDPSSLGISVGIVILLMALGIAATAGVLLLRSRRLL